MSVQINGTQGLTFDNGSKLASQLGIFNRVIDGGFIINQRGYVTNTALSLGVYAHDRWKAGSSGCTYTFTQGSAGVNTTITITAGSLQQVIEGSNMPEGGTYTLSWTGTAQARVNGGSYSASPLTTTGLTAGANCTIEFNTGTVGSVQMETGASASSFAFRPYGTELALCQRYYWKGTWFGGACADDDYSVNALGGEFSTTMRATPTIIITGGSMAGHHGTAPNDTFGVNADSVGFSWSGSAYRSIGARASVDFNASAEL
jgi:hypothetical protein